MVVVAQSMLAVTRADEPKKGDVIRAELGGKDTIEVVYIPPGDFMMGSTPEEKKWATVLKVVLKRARNANRMKARNLAKCALPTVSGWDERK